MKYNESYLIKYKTPENEYFQLVNGCFKHRETAMAKVEQIKQNKQIESIILRKRTGYRTSKVYSWSKGFETIYLGR